jgi:hypothetical protein
MNVKIVNTILISTNNNAGIAKIKIIALMKNAS